MNLIDKENNLTISLVDFTNHTLQTFLELAFILGACNQGTHIQAVNSFTLQVLGNIATHNPVGQTFGNGCLAHARFAYQNRIVLGTAAQNLQHTANLLVTSYHGVQLTSLSQLVQVLGILVQGIVAVLSALTAHFATFPQIGDSGTQTLFAHTGILHQMRQFVASAQQSQQQMLNAHKVVAHFSGQLRCFHQSLVGIVAQILATATHTGQLVEQGIHLLCQPRNVHLQFLQQEWRHILVHAEHTFHQMARLNSLMLTGGCNLLCLLHSFLRFNGKVVNVHNSIVFLLITTSTIEPPRPNGHFVTTPIQTVPTTKTF